MTVAIWEITGNLKSKLDKPHSYFHTRVLATSIQDAIEAALRIDPDRIIWKAKSKGGVQHITADAYNELSAEK